MYAKKLTTREISEQIEDIYGFEVSEGMGIRYHQQDTS
jgi:putative transposase